MSLYNSGGSNGHVRLPDSSVLTTFVGTTYSFEGWFKAETHTAYSGLFSFGSGGDEFLAYPTATGLIVYTGPQAAATIPTGVWHHFMYVNIPGSTGKWLLNGSLLTTTGSSKNAAIASALRCLIGDTGGEYFRGWCSEFRVWSGDQSANAATRMYQRMDGTETDLIANWPMSDGSGMGVRDMVDNPANGGTRVGNLAWSADEPAGLAEGPGAAPIDSPPTFGTPSIVFFDSHEAYKTTAESANTLLYWYGSTGTTTTVVDGIGPFGNRALRFVGRSYVQGNVRRTSSTMIAEGDTVTAGAYFYIEVLPESGEVMDLLVAHSGIYAHLCLTVTPTGKLRLHREWHLDALLKESDITLSAGQWYHIEWQCKIGDVNGTVLVRVDGVNVMNYYGDTKDHTDGSVSHMLFGSKYGSGLATMRCSYPYITRGTRGFLGAVRGKRLIASADATYSEPTRWSPALTYYDHINDVGYDTGNGGLRFASGQRVTSLYTDMATTGFVGLIVTAMYTDNAAAHSNVALARRAGVDGEGTTTIGSATSSTYPLASIIENDPSTGLPWTVDGINEAEFGWKAITGASTYPHVFLLSVEAISLSEITVDDPPVTPPTILWMDSHQSYIAGGNITTWYGAAGSPGPVVTDGIGPWGERGILLEYRARITKPISIPAGDRVTIGRWVGMPATPLGNIELLMLQAGATTQMAVLANNTGALVLKAGDNLGGTVLQTVAGVFTPGSMKFVELTFISSSTVGQAKVRVDGVEVASFTGDTTRSASTGDIITVAMWGSLWGSNAADDTYCIYPYITTGVGSDGTGFLGQLRAGRIKPIGAGTYAESVNTFVTPGDTEAWQALDDVPVLTSSGSDHITMNTVGNRATFQMENVTAADIVAVVGMINANAGSSSSALLALDGATERLGTTAPLFNPTRVVISPLSVNPATGAVFTDAEINANEWGMKTITATATVTYYQFGVDIFTSGAAITVGAAPPPVGSTRRAPQTTWL